MSNKCGLIGFHIQTGLCVGAWIVETKVRQLLCEKDGLDSVPEVDLRSIAKTLRCQRALGLIQLGCGQQMNDTIRYKSFLLPMLSKHLVKKDPLLFDQELSSTEKSRTQGFQGAVVFLFGTN